MDSQSTFSVGDIATALNISTSTVHNWTAHPILIGYLSNMATRTGAFENAGERRYSRDDLYVLNTVNSNNPRKTSWEAIASVLESGERDKNLPESAMLVLAPTSGEAFYTLARAEEQITMLKNRVKELEISLEEKDRLLLEKSEMVKEEHVDLLKQIGRLEFILGLNGIDPETGTKKASDQ